MALNRFLYFSALVMALVFYFVSTAWASWVLLVAVAALPWVGLLFSLPAILSCRLSAALPAVTEQRQRTLLHLRISSLGFLPTPELRLHLNLRSRDTERDVRFLSRLTRADGILAVPTQNCGFLAPVFLKGRVYDYLGLFRFPIRLPLLEPMAVFPPEHIPEPMPDLDQVLNQQLRPKAGGGYSEVHDHRPYRPGDPVKGIHWKLSLKTEELIVREPMEPVQRKIILAVCTPRGPERREKTLGSLRYLSKWLLERGIPHSVVWMDGSKLVRAEARDNDGLTESLRGACLAAEDSAPLPQLLPLQADWIYRIGEEEPL